MTSFGFPISVGLVDRTFTVYRACHGPDQDSLVRAMYSNYEARRPPHPTDLRATVLHMAVSMFEREGPLLVLARRRPDRVGTHIARLELRPDIGICLADTGSPGHWSVWGLPEHLVACVVEIAEVNTSDA